MKKIIFITALAIIGFSGKAQIPVVSVSASTDSICDGASTTLTASELLLIHGHLLQGFPLSQGQLLLQVLLLTQLIRLQIHNKVAPFGNYYN